MPFVAIYKLLDVRNFFASKKFGSMTRTHIYIESTHIDDTKNIFLFEHTLSTFRRVFYNFSVLFPIMSLTHDIDKVSLLISEYKVSFL